MQALNEAKDQCMQHVVARDFSASEQEYALHICRGLDRKFARAGIDLRLESREVADLISGELRQLYSITAGDAMQWSMQCAMGNAEFDQEKEDEIPILCKYYNEFIRQDNWSSDERAFMDVLNKYEDIKTQGLGNFARLITQSRLSSSRIKP